MINASCFKNSCRKDEKILSKESSYTDWLWSIRIFSWDFMFYVNHCLPARLLINSRTCDFSPVTVACNAVNIVCNDSCLCTVASGQESAGIVMSHGDSAQRFEQHRKMGLVTNIFTKEALTVLKGNLGIGNVRSFSFLYFQK